MVGINLHFTPLGLYWCVGSFGCYLVLCVPHHPDETFMACFPRYFQDARLIIICVIC